MTAAPADDAGDPKLTDWTACKVAAAARDARQKAFDDATVRFDKALAASGQLGSQAASSSGAGTPQAGGGGSAPSDAALQTVARAVESIANAPDIDEPLMFCIALLDPTTTGAGTAPASPDLTATCREILRSTAEQDESLRASFVDFGGNTVTVQSLARTGLLTTFRRYISTPAGSDASARNERLRRRIGLARAAAARLGLPNAPPDIQAMQVGNARAVARLLEVLRAIETDEAGKAALQD